MNVKLIKSKDFVFNDENNVEQKGTVHTVAYKGTVFNVSSLDFEDKELSIKDKVLTIGTKVEVHREPYMDSLGNQAMGLKLKPASDLVISALSR
jgi:hypothetical protein